MIDIGSRFYVPFNRMDVIVVVATSGLENGSEKNVVFKKT